jgi:Ca2+-binding RTX toxin-like protein
MKSFEQVEFQGYATGITAQHEHTLAVVDPGVEALPSLLRVLGETPVLVLDPALPVLDQILERLGTHQDVTTLHVLAHGRPGAVSFKAEPLDELAITVEAYRWRELGFALAPGARILLWACDVAADDAGRHFIDHFADIVGVPVHAATTRIGAAERGGRWQLDYPTSAGLLPAPAPISQLQSYEGVMATFTATTNQDSLNGGASNTADTFDFTSGTVQVNDAFNGGSGTDIIRIASNATVDFSVLSPTGLLSFETITFNGTGSITFSSAQFGTGLISNSLSLNGASFSTQNLTVNMVTAGSFSAASWNTNNWSGSDLITINGSTGNETITGSSEDDRITGGAGNDSISGGSGGTDTLVLSGARSNYTITVSGNVYTVVDNRSGSPDGTDTFTNIDQISFNGTTTSVPGLDTTPPNGGTLSLQNFNDTGTSNSDRISTDTAFDLSLAGATGGLTVNYERSVNGGAWTSTTAGQSGLADGTYSYRTYVQESSGNRGYSNVVTVVVDTMAPALPSLSLTSVTDSGAVGDFITNSASITVVPTGDSGTTLRVNGTVVAAGATSGAIALVEGNNTVTLTSTDTAGNVATRSYTVVRDSTVAAPTVTLASDTGTSPSDAITSASALTIGAEVGATVEYSLDGTTWSNSFSAQEGANTVRVRQIDVAGNVSAATVFSFTLDTSAAAPVVTLTNDTGGSNTDGVTSNAALSIVSENAALVEYSVNGGTTWSTTLSPQQGVNNIQVRQTDVAGNVSAPTSFSFTLDNQAAQAPGVALANDTGLDGDGVTRDASLNLTGVETNALVQYSTDEGASWSNSFVAVEGNNLVWVRQLDVAGNASAESAISFVLDLTGPTGPVGVSLAADSGLPGDNVSNNAELVLSEIEDGMTVEYSTDQGTTWSQSFSAQQGPNSVWIRQTDIAGNASAVTQFAFTFDSETPAAPGASLASDTGDSNTDGLTRLAALALTGVEQGALVEYSSDGTTWTTTYAPTEGENLVHVRQTDLAGNVSGDSVVAFTLDTIVPAALSVVLDVDTGANSADRITSEALLVVTGEEIGATIEYSTDGNAWTSSYDVQEGVNSVYVRQLVAAGNASEAALFEFTLDTGAPVEPGVQLTTDTGSSDMDRVSSLGALTVTSEDGALVEYSTNGDDWSLSFSPAEGDNLVYVRQTDAAGNVSPVASFAFTLDTTAPDAPAVVLVEDTGALSNDGVTANADFTVTAEPDAVVEYSLNGSNWSGSFSPVQGENTVHVRQTDAAGNHSAASTLIFTLDLSIPDAPAVQLTADTGLSTSDRNTNQGALTVAGEQGATFEFSVDSGSTWSNGFTAVEGANEVLVRQTDAAGNVSASTTLSFELDTINPAAPGVSLVDDTGLATGDSITSNGLLAIDAEATAKVEYSLDGNTWSTAFVAAEGAQTIQVRQTDLAGNVSATSLFTFTLDTTNPAAPAVSLTSDTGAAGDDRITSSGALTVGAENGAKIEYSLDGSTWTESFTATEGENTIQVRQTDVAGNVSAVTVFNFTLDTAALAPTVTLADDTATPGDFLTSNGQLTVGAETGALVEYSTDGGNTWSAAFAASEGLNNIQVRQTDLAGNVSGATAFQFTLDTTIATPTIALVTNSGSDQDTLTNDAALLISAPAGDVTRVITLDNAPVAAYVPPTEDGTYTVVIVDTDTAGNTASASFTFTLDKSIAAPVVSLTNDTNGADGITSDAAVTVAEATETVTRTYSLDGGAATASYVAPTTDGIHTVVVTDTDLAGNAASTSFAFTLDTTIATPTIALVTNSGSDQDTLTNDAALSISAPAGDVSRVITLDSAPVAAYVPPTEDGTYTVVIVDTDTAGNTASASFTFTLDKSIAAPMVSLTNDTNGADGITSDAAVTVADAAETVTRTYSLDGGAATANYVLPTTDGIHTVVVTDTDLAGNAASTSFAFTLDTTIATPTIALVTNSGSDQDSLTNDAALSISAPAGDVSRVITLDSAPVAAYVPPTEDGTYTVVIVDTDTAGNTASASFTFTLDKTIAAPMVSLTNDTNGADGITSDAAVTVADAAETVTRTYSLDGGAATASYVAPTTDGIHTVVVTDTDLAGNAASTSFAFTLDTTIATPTIALVTNSGSDQDSLTNDAALAISEPAGDVTRVITLNTAPVAAYAPPTEDGTYTVVIVDTDTAGNTASASFTFTLDKTVAAPVVSLLSDTGTSGDGITSNPAIVVDPAGETVTRTYSLNGGPATSEYVAPTADGVHTVVVTDTDLAGNAASTSFAFTLDGFLATPTIALVTNSGSDQDTLTNDAALAISAPAGDVTRVITLDNAPVAAYAPPTEDGTYTVVIVDTDTAGNTASASFTFTLDKSIAAPMVSLTNDTNGADLTTSDAAVTVADAAETVTRTYSLDGGAATASYVAPTTDGIHTVVVTDTDLAGNAASTSFAFTLDTTIATPTIALVTNSGSDQDSLTNDAALAISEPAGDVTRVITLNTAPVAAYAPPTEDGTYTVVIVDTDTAGNTASASFTFTLDKTVAAPVVSLLSDTGTSGDGITSNPAIVVDPAGETVTRTYSLNGGPATSEYVAPTADGDHTVVVTDTDLAGNAASTSFTFTLDGFLATPTIALVTNSGSDQDMLTNDAALLISAPAGDVTRVIKLDGNVVEPYQAPTADGTYTVEVTDTDTAGNSSTASITFTLDKTIAAPVVSLVSDTGTSGDGITSNPAIVVDPAGETVTRTYSLNGGAATSEYVAPTADGVHTVVVTDTDLAGNAASTSFAFTLDGFLAAPTIALVTNSGSDQDTLTNDAALSISAAAVDVTRVITLNTTPVAAYAPPTEDGTYTVVIVDTDTAGNTASASFTFTLDTTIAAPMASLTNDTNGADLTTSDAAVTVADAAETVTRTYSLDGGAATASYVAPTTDGIHTVVVTDTDLAGNAASTSFAFTLDTTIATPTIALVTNSGSDQDMLTNDAALLISAPAGDVTRVIKLDGNVVEPYQAPTVDGTYTVEVIDTDTAGNSSTASITFTLDTTIAAPAVSLLSDTGTSGDGITSNPAIVVDPAGETVTRTYSLDGGASTASYVAPTGDGEYTVVVTDTDLAGNAASTSFNFTLNGVIATPTVALAVDSGSAGNDGITNDGALNISAAAPNVSRVITVNGIEVPTYVPPTEDMAYTVVVTDTNLAGASASTTLTFTLDKTVAAPVVTLVQDTGTNDGITSNAAITVDPAAETVTRTYSVNGGAASSSYVAPTADGNYTVLVTDTDVAGNAASSTVTFTLDQAIGAPSIALVSDTGANSADKITSNAALNISAAAGDVTRSVTINNGAAASSYVAPTTDGTYTVLVTDTDTAGNTASSSFTFTLDQTIAAPSIALVSDSGANTGDKITSNAALNISAAAGDVTRSVTINNGAAASSYVAPTTDGAYTVLVTDTDAAGNAASSSFTFTLDKTIAAPTVALVSDTGSNTTDRMTNNAALNISVAAGDVTRSVQINGGAASSSYVAPTADGTYTVLVTDTDAVGNSASSSFTFTLDKTVAAPGFAHDKTTVGNGQTLVTTVTFAEAVDGLAMTDFVVTNGVGTITGMTVISPTQVQLTLSPALGLSNVAGAIALTGAWADLAGNAGGTAQSTTFTVNTPSVVNGVTITGTANNDIIDATHSVGTQPLPTIAGDTINGGSGADSIDGLGGNDSLIGGIGNDTILGSGGVDFIDAGTGDDRADGGEGNDTVEGLDGHDSLAGGAGNDSVDGWTGNDTLDGGIGNDTMDGGSGNDVYYVDASGDVIWEDAGNGTDTIYVSAASWVMGDNLETMILTGTNQSVTGNIGANTITGTSGAESINGGSGADLINGGGGTDSLNGGAGADTIVGGAGADRLTGAAGNDSFRFLSSSEGSDVITDFQGAGAAGGDLIQISRAGFGISATATLDLFVNGTEATPTADALDAVFRYLSTTGQLFFDSNGAAAGGEIEIAVLNVSGTTHPARLIASDIALI